MPEHYESLLWITGGALVLLALWYLSYRYVRWDTRRSGLRELERKAWIAAAVVLPLFGFALYLFIQVLQRYLTPPAAPPPGRDRELYLNLSMPASTPAPPRQVPMPEPVHADGQADGGARAYRTPATVRAPYRSLNVRYALVAVDGPHKGQSFAVHRLPARIGRGPEAAISLEQDLNVSRQHAEIYEWNGTLHLRDLGSSHGSYVNGSRAVDQPLGPGDHLVIGQTALILRELP